jgi:2-polyprenyl-6-methoxyphenol hydroxylase-like FAD-dependent oxidoreductase
MHAHPPVFLAASGTTKAAVNAWQLVDCLVRAGGDVGAALAAYDAAALPLARRLVEVGVGIGTASQFPGAVRESAA